MSQENVEIAHRLSEAFNRRDLGTYVALSDREVEFTTLAVEMEGSFHGHDGVRRLWQEVLAIAPDLTLEIEQTRHFRNVVIVTVRYRAHGRGSEVPLEGTYWSVAEFRDQKLVSSRDYASKIEALEAAGVRE